MKQKINSCATQHNPIPKMFPLNYLVIVKEQLVVFVSITFTYFLPAFTVDFAVLMFTCPHCLNGARLKSYYTSARVSIALSSCDRFGLGCVCIWFMLQCSCNDILSAV